MPEGASALSGWWSSTTSTDSKNRAASAANRIISTAPMEKLGAISTPTSGAAASQPRSVVEPVVVEAGGADHGVDAVLDAELQVVHDHVGVGEVDDGLGAGGDQVVQRVVGVDPRDQLGVGRLVDRSAHLGPDLAQRSEHPDLQQRLAHGLQPSGATPIGR